MEYRGETNKKILKNYLKSKISATWPLYPRQGIFEKMGFPRDRSVSFSSSTFVNGQQLTSNTLDEVKIHFHFILRASAKALWDSWILRCPISGSIISSTVRTLFSSRFLTFDIPLIVGFNRANLFSFAFLIMFLTWIDISESWEILKILVMRKRGRDAEWSHKASNNRRSGNEPRRQG